MTTYGFRCTACNHVAWGDTAVNGRGCPACHTGEMQHDIDVPFGHLDAFTGLGGYTLHYLPLDERGNLTGDVLCATCATEERDAEEMPHGMLCETYDEGPTEFCDSCNCEIESSYGDPVAIPTLTRSEVRKLSRYIRAAGYTLPRCGVSVEVPLAAREDFRKPGANEGWRGYVPTRVAHDARGYYFTSWE